MKYAIVFTFAFLALANACSSNSKEFANRGVIAQTLKSKLIEVKEMIDAHFLKSEQEFIEKIGEAQKQQTKVLIDLVTYRVRHNRNSIYESVQNVLDTVGILEDKIFSIPKDIGKKIISIPKDIGNKIVNIPKDVYNQLPGKR